MTAVKPAEAVVVVNETNSNTKFDIYISYSQEDKQLVSLLSQKLSVGMKYKVGKMSGNDESSSSSPQTQITYLDHICKAIANAHCVLCCISKAYAKSESCVREINYALVKKKPLIIVMLENLYLNANEVEDDLGSVGFIITPLTRFNFFLNIEKSSLSDNNLSNVWSGQIFDYMIRSIDETLTHVKRNAQLMRQAVIHQLKDGSGNLNKLNYNFIRVQPKGSNLGSQREEMIKNGKNFLGYFTKHRVKIKWASFTLLILLIGIGCGILIGILIRFISISNNIIYLDSISSLGKLNVTSTLELKNFLRNHWPFDGNITDVINDESLRMDSTKIEIEYELDRFGNISKAIRLRNNQYLRALSNTYFESSSDGYTISLWLNYTRCGCLLDFGNGQNEDNVILSIASLSSNRTECATPSFAAYDTNGMYLYDDMPNEKTNETSAYVYAENIQLLANKWHHLAVSVNATKILMYIDGMRVKESRIMATSSTTRFFNYIGTDFSKKSFYHGLLDDLRIYNKSLLSNEIEKIFKQFD